MFICKQNDFSCQGEFLQGLQPALGKALKGPRCLDKVRDVGGERRNPAQLRWKLLLPEQAALGAGSSGTCCCRLSPSSPPSAEISLQHLSTEKLCLVSAEMSVARWSCSGREGEEEEVEDGGRCCPGCAGLSWAPREEGSCHTGQDQAL